MNERQLTIESFNNSFGDKKDEDIVIYGIGKNTEYILEHFTEHSIVALMDGVKQDGVIYGKPIISKKRLIETGVKKLVIIATAASAKIIYSRIAAFCDENGIEVLDINGNKYRKQDDVHKDFSKYENITEKALKEKINKADVISFDVFDTLIMRTVMYPRDIFSICEKEINKAGYKLDGYAQIRESTEDLLYAQGMAPGIALIYEQLSKTMSIDDAVVQVCKDIEIQIERQCLICRKEMYDVFCYAVSIGKTVVLTSDMHLSEGILKDILTNLDFPLRNVEFFISCDYNATKYNGDLFGILRKKHHDKIILHIGDNHVSDRCRALECGIDDTFLICSSIEMLNDSYASCLIKYDDSLDNRIIIGEFISRQLNNPFLFSSTNGKFYISNQYEMVYSFIAPFIYSFFSWMISKAKELKLDYLLFSSRDGYILYQLYSEYKTRVPDAAEAVYFYTSRAVSSITCLYDENDIKHFMTYPFDGTLEDMLKIRFYLEDTDIMQAKPGESSEDYILRHKDAIFNNAVNMRNRYLKYFETLNISSNSRIGFIDFVATGTCQHGIQKLFNLDLYGLYFAQIRRSSYNINVHAMYGTTGIFKEKYFFLNDYYAFENILTSHETTVIDFDESGNPVFSEEYRTKDELTFVRLVCDAAKNYAEHSHIDITDSFNINEELPDYLYSLLCKKYSIPANACSLTGRRESAFSNRMHTIIEED